MCTASQVNYTNKQNMFGKQGIHKWSMMIGNKYCLQMYNTDAYILLSSKPTGLLILVIYAVMWNVYVDYSSIAVGHTYTMSETYLPRDTCP